MKTIVDTAIANGKFTHLLAALKAASLLDTLRAPGPYTIFAPTDAAFGRLTPGALRALMKDTRRLKTVLTLHIVSGTYVARNLMPGEVRTVEGHSILYATDGLVMSVSGATIEQADIVASNGVIHAIDAVIMPGSGSLPAVA